MYPNLIPTMSIPLGLKQDLAQRVCNYLTAHDYECFVGGSVRFCCQSTDSDVDIIVHVPEHTWNNFMLAVRMAGCYPVNVDDTNSYDNTKIKVVHVGSDIDLLVVFDKEYYMQESDNHIMIERMMSGLSRPYRKTLKDYVLELKGYGVKGSTIYQMLVLAARER